MIYILLIDAKMLIMLESNNYENYILVYLLSRIRLSTSKREKTYYII